MAKLDGSCGMGLGKLPQKQSIALMVFLSLLQATLKNAQRICLLSRVSGNVILQNERLNKNVD